MTTKECPDSNATINDKRDTFLPCADVSGEPLHYYIAKGKQHAETAKFL